MFIDIMMLSCAARPRFVDLRIVRILSLWGGSRPSTPTEPTKSQKDTRQRGRAPANHPANNRPKPKNIAYRWPCPPQTQC